MTAPTMVTEADRHIDRSRAAMSELIVRLVEHGLLAWMPDERDRRRTLAHGSGAPNAGKVPKRAFAHATRPGT